MYKGAVFFDYDGTLVDETANISRPTTTTLNSLKELKENGYLVALCTGRAKCYVPPEIDFQFDCYITSNGGCAEINNEIIYNDCFDIQDLPPMIQFFKETQMNYTYETHDYCYCNDINERCFQLMAKRYNLPLKNFVPLENIICHNVNKIVLTFDDIQKLKNFEKKYGHKYDTTPQYEGASSCDIGKKGVSKACGVKAVIDHLHLNVKDTYAMGDGANDTEMFQIVGTSIAMGTHAPVLDEFATYVTDTVANNGLRNALQKYKLIF